MPLKACNARSLASAAGYGLRAVDPSPPILGFTKIQKHLPPNLSVLLWRARHKTFCTSAGIEIALSNEYPRLPPELRKGEDTYREEQFHEALRKVSGMIFLCEHETQGIAYQQALSAGIPILAWDRGGYWQDPDYYPYRVKFKPVSSVPYWDDRCGLKFESAAEFPKRLSEFLGKLDANGFHPRAYILENLTLEHCASRYLEIVENVQRALAE